MWGSDHNPVLALSYPNLPGKKKLSNLINSGLIVKNYRK